MTGAPYQMVTGPVGILSSSAREGMWVPTCRECGYPKLGWLPVLATPLWLLIQASWWQAVMAGIRVVALGDER